MDAKPRRRYLPRFSLRTLLIGVLFAGSGFGLWYCWEPKFHAYPLLQSTEAPVCEYWISPDGQYVGAGAVDGSVVMWRIANLERILEVKAYDARVSEVCFSPDSQTMATCGFAEPTKLWECETGKVTELTYFDGTIASGYGVNFSPDSRLLVRGIGSGTEVWDLQTGQCLVKLPVNWDRYNGGFLKGGKMIETNSSYYEIPSGRAAVRPENVEERFRVKQVRSPNDGSFYIGRMKGSYNLCVYKRRQAYWWLTQLPEFWLTALFGIALVWSLRRDWKTLWARKVEAKAVVETKSSDA